jgi:TorA maturation chaperone TorD
MQDSQSLGPAAAGLLELSARLLVVELDSAALQALLHEDVLSIFEELQPGAASYLKSAQDSPDIREEIDAEFCRLFLMSKATSPMASVWLPGEQLANGARIAALVDGWQEQLDVELNDGPWGNLPRDHFAMLLGLYALALLADEHADVAKEIRELLLAPALPRFAEALCQHSSNPVYRAGVKLAEMLIAP